MLLNMGLSGQTFAGADVGGYYGHPSPELYARWLQTAAFTPLMRTHTERSTPAQEPWSFGEEMEAVNRQAIRMRYQFLPYLYSVFYEASKLGWPVMRPLFFEFPADTETYDLDDQFLVGHAVMICSDYDPGLPKKTVYFPRGSDWYDFYTGTRYPGGKRAQIELHLSRIPVFPAGRNVCSSAARGTVCRGTKAARVAP